MKLKFVHILAFAGLLLISSCDGCNNQGPGCAPIWAVQYSNPALIAEVDTVNTTMSLQVATMVPNLDDMQGEVYQAYFVGDFDVVVPFSNFVAGPYQTNDGNPYAEMIMYNSEVPDTILDTTFVRAGISRDFIYAMTGLQSNQKPRLISPSPNGTFRIRKLGSNMLARVTSGADTVIQTLTMPFTPVRFAFRLGSFNDSAVSTTTAIKIDAFPVSGTTGCTLLSDEFKCNSIYIP